ncbi:hypothetical protein RHS03_00065, partial [Rhizoctonia solani]
MASLAKGSFHSSSTGKTRKPMFSTGEWGEGAVFDWYKSLQNSSQAVLVNKLQVRIDRNQPPHRFVVAYLHGGVVCRFDRRPEEINPGKVLFETISRSRLKAADEFNHFLENDPEYLLIQRSTTCEIDLDLPPNTDVLLILSACFALSRDTDASDYDLLTYNCYFFSWTITMVVVRFVLPFRIPAANNIFQTSTLAMNNLSDSITNKIIKALLSIVLDVIAAARQTAGKRIQKGMYLCERVIWKLPTSAMCFLYKQALTLQLYFGLEDTIRSKTHERMVQICHKLLEDVLAQEGTAQKVEKRLWIHELKNDIRNWFHTQMASTFWDAILDIIATVHGKVDGQQTLANIEADPCRRSRIVVNLIGDAQWIQLWNEALSAALPAARDAVRERGSVLVTESSTQLHNELFDIAFTAGSHAALSAAQNVVERTRPAQNNPKRDQMWETIWSVWDRMWSIANDRTRATVVPIVEQAVEEIVTLVTHEVIANIRGGQGQPAQSWVKYKKEKKTPLTASSFQEHISHSVKSAYPTAGYRTDLIYSAMGRAWNDAVGVLQPGESGQ